MSKWRRDGRTIGIVDESDTQTNGMLQPVCYLETYDFRPEVVDHYGKLMLNAEGMYKLLQELYFGNHCSAEVDRMIVNTLRDLI